MGELIEGEIVKGELVKIESQPCFPTEFVHVGIFEEYIKDAIRTNFGHFFNITELYDSRESKIVLLLEREHITFKKEFYIPRTQDWQRFQHTVDNFVQGFVNDWNRLVSEQMIKREKIYTQAKLINPYFTPAKDLALFYKTQYQAKIEEQMRLQHGTADE